MSRENGAFAAQPKAFMKYVITQMNPVNHLLYRPQYEFIVDDENNIAMDFIGRNESMQDSYDQICMKLGLQSSRLATVNSSQHRPYMEYYDDETYSLVHDLYKKDIDMFDYR